MPEIIDIEDVIRGINEIHKGYMRDKDKPGLTGVIARCGLATDQAMVLWRVKESNSETDPNDIIEAIIVAFTAALFGEISQFTQDTNDQIVMAQRCLAEMASSLAGAISASRTGHLPMKSYESKQAGRA